MRTIRNLLAVAATLAAVAGISATTASATHWGHGHRHISYHHHAAYIARPVYHAVHYHHAPIVVRHFYLPRPVYHHHAHYARPVVHHYYHHTAWRPAAHHVHRRCW